MTTPAPPEPKPDEMTNKERLELKLAADDRVMGLRNENAGLRDKIDSLQARVAELERVIAAKDEALQRILESGRAVSTCRAALNLKAEP